jgi:hypothetical protein
MILNIRRLLQWVRLRRIRTSRLFPEEVRLMFIKSIPGNKRKESGSMVGDGSRIPVNLLRIQLIMKSSQHFHSYLV